MTTIAYRDGVLASDTLGTANNVRECEFRKIAKVNGWLVGIAGTLHVANSIMRWLKTNGGKLERPPESVVGEGDRGNVNAIFVNQKSGAVYLMDSCGEPYKVKVRFYALGSGAYHAVGAMEMGASATQAVRVASKWDMATGPKIQSIKR